MRMVGQEVGRSVLPRWRVEGMTRDRGQNRTWHPVKTDNDSTCLTYDTRNPERMAAHWRVSAVGSSTAYAWDTEEAQLRGRRVSCIHATCSNKEVALTGFPHSQRLVC